VGGWAEGEAVLMVFLARVPMGVRGVLLIEGLAANAFRGVLQSLPLWMLDLVLPCQ
jgi:hypothetical protein